MCVGGGDGIGEMEAGGGMEVRGGGGEEEGIFEKPRNIENRLAWVDNM